LPLEVEDLEDEVAGLTTRLEKIKSDLVTIEDISKLKKDAIDNHQEAKKNIPNNKDVRNKRINSTKEVEFQELEIQLSEKQIKELKASIEMLKKK
jgi:hypothetical protein